MLEHDYSDIRPHLYHRGGVQARHEPDTLGMIAEVARTPECAPATKIIMRSTTWRRVYAESNHTLERNGQDMLDLTGGVLVEVDDTIPFFPGFQVHREVR